MNAPSPVNQAAAGAPTAIARRPQPNDFRPLQELTVGEMLEDPRVMKAMAESAPQHLSPQRLLRVMAQALRKTPKLALCSPLSLLGAMITCASLGLEPNTPLGHCYLIPFEKREKRGTQWVTAGVEVNLIIGYQGLIDLSRRTGNLVSIHADVVYEGDEFSYEYGSNMHLRHVPNGLSRENRKPVSAYAIAKLADGEAFEVLAYPEVMRIRDATQAYKQAMIGKDRGDRNWASSPWIAYEHEMACKTMVRRVSKWLPKSIEFATAVQMDSLAERGMIDFQAIAAQPMLAHDPDAVTFDQETGEITDKKAEVTQTTTAKPTPPKPPAAKVKEEPKPTPAELAAAAEAAAKAAAEQEAAEREADRLQREAQGEPVTVQEEQTQAEDDDGWDDYTKMMLDELKVQTTHKDASATNVTFRDAVVGAVDRKEITEERGNVLLASWNQAAIARLTDLQAAPKKEAPKPPTKGK